MYQQADVCPSGSLGHHLRPIAVSAKSLQSILRLGLGLITEVIWGFAAPHIALWVLRFHTLEPQPTPEEA